MSHADPGASAPDGVPGALLPGTPAGRAGLAGLLAAPDHALIGLDFDGTLSPIVADPAAARAQPDAVAALRALAPLVGTLAVITGRPAGWVVTDGGLGGVPGLTVLGHYGFERWANGELTPRATPPGVVAARERLPGVLAAAGAPDGVWTEDKGHAVAVHTRRTAQPGQTLEQLRPALAELAAETGLRAEPGRLVLELRPPGMDKGAALKDLVNERNSQAVLFGGDDLGDIPAFQAVGELREQGIPGLTVCSGSAEVSELAERSDLVVDGPAGVVALLSWLAGQAG